MGLKKGVGVTTIVSTLLGEVNLGLLQIRDPRKRKKVLPAVTFHHSHLNEFEKLPKIIALYTLPTMSSDPKQRLEALNSQMAVKPSSPEATEELPRIPQVAPDSVGPYVSPHLYNISH